MKPVDFAIAIAPDIVEARRLLVAAGAGGRLMAGGQSLGPMLNFRLARPNTVVEIARAHDLRGVIEEPDHIVYGAAVTHADIEDGRVPDATPGWLSAIAGGIAYRAVRNRGTVGGSLAHADPAADWLVTLTALAAEIVILGAGGERRGAMPDFITGPFATSLGPGEILRAVRVPRRTATARFGHWKFCRKIGEFAKASAAVLVDRERGECRIAVGALEAAPVLLADPAAILADPSRALAALRAALPARSADSLAVHALAVVRAIARMRQGDA